MATSGTISLTLGGGVRAVLNWSLNSQSGMQSTIWYDVTWSYTGSKAITLSGDVYLHTSSTSERLIASGFTQYSAGQRITSGYITVSRDQATNTGTLTLGLSSSSGEYWYDGDNYDGEHSYSGRSDVRNWTINTTTPAGTPAQITAVSDFTDETNPVITYSYDRGLGVDSVTLEAAISFTGATDDIPYRTISSTDTTYTFSLTGTERSKLWTLLDNGNTATVRFYIRTTEVIEGEVRYMYNFMPKTFKFVNYKPVITTVDHDLPLVIDNNSDTLRLTGDPKTMVRYFSTAYINAQAIARKGATIVATEVRNGDITLNNFSTQIENISNNTFYFTVTDNRGWITDTAAVFNNLQDLKWIDYIKLTCNVQHEPMGADGELVVHVTGKYFDGNFGIAPNRLTLEYAIRNMSEAAGEDNWIPLGNEGVVEPNVDDEGNYTHTFTISGLDYKGRYEVKVRANDELMPDYSIASVVVAATPIFDWDKNDFTFNIPVKMTAGFEYPQRMIWSGESQLGATDTIDISEYPVSTQPNGIVLVFSLFRNEKAEDASVHSFFVSKAEVVHLLNGAPHMFMMGINSNLSVFGSKYVYISNTQIRGFDGNDKSGTAASGITFNNNNFVLRYVIGV